MCDAKVREALGNGQAADLRMQGLGIKNCMEMLDSIKKQLQEIPTRSEVREMIHDSLRIHVETCDAARDDGRKQPEPNKFKLGLAKFGLEAEGKSGVVLGAILGLALAWLVLGVAPYILSWLQAFFAK